MKKAKGLMVFKVIRRRGRHNIFLAECFIIEFGSIKISLPGLSEEALSTTPDVTLYFIQLAMQVLCRTPTILHKLRAHIHLMQVLEVSLVVLIIQLILIGCQTKVSLGGLN